MTHTLDRFTRAHILASARAWIGTPYHHQASTRGAGADCIGLVRGVYRDLLGADPEPLPGYTRDWAEATGIETLLAAAHRHLVAVEPTRARPGDVLVFRYRHRFVAKHAGLLAELAGAPTLIHAAEGTAVVEVAMSDWWRRRIAGAFSFPGVID